MEFDNYKKNTRLLIKNYLENKSNTRIYFSSSPTF
jgi:hypothetical protein